MLESNTFDKDVVTGMKNAAALMKQQNKEMNLDDMHDLKDELDDMMAENNERQDYFAKIANETGDDML